jgi:outer membrane protein assembly factor BamB
VGVTLAVLKDAEAIPVLIDLLGELPSDQAWPAEDLLVQLAGDRTPNVPLGRDAAGRKKCRDAWAAWWKQNADKVDLAKLAEGPRFHGYTVIAEMNRVRELGTDGKVRWEIAGLQYAIDAQVVRRDRVLITEYSGRKVTERDLDGKVVWEKATPDYPTAAQRLPNGNTFIVCRTRLLEVTPEGREVFDYTPAGFIICGAQKLRDGRIVLAANNGQIKRLDASGKEEKTVNVGGTLYVMGNLDVLPNGNVLVPTYIGNKVLEYDPDGKLVWELGVTRPTSVHRLPNGNTIVTSLLNQQVAEYDRTGKQVWTYKSDGGGGRVMRVKRR